MKCPACGASANYFKCDKCGDVRCSGNSKCPGTLGKKEGRGACSANCIACHHGTMRSIPH